MFDGIHHDNGIFTKTYLTFEMIRSEIYNKNTGEKLIMFEDDDFEFEKPVKHYGDTFIVKQMVLNGIPDEEMTGNNNISDASRKIFIEAAKNWQLMLAKFKATAVPRNLLKVLDNNKKSEQEALLKGLNLTPDVLMAFLIKADEAGFTLSQYTSEFSQKGVDLSKMPLAYEVMKDGTVKVFGETKLSDGQLKQAIKHRKVKVAKFLDKGENWHCFFVTYQSLNGEETWLGQPQPHYHYLSNAFGISREEVIAQLKSEKYKLGNLPHIKLDEYGKQPD